LPLSITTPGNYKLTGNLTGEIDIYEPIGGPVIVDLNGFTITGSIFIQGSTGKFPLTIRNGTINSIGSYAAIEDYSVGNIRVDHIVFNECRYGMILYGVANSTISNCQFIGLPGGSGLDGIFDDFSRGNVYSNLTFQYIVTPLLVFRGSSLNSCQFAPPQP
jgi:hypothetical protein